MVQGRTLSPNDHPPTHQILGAAKKPGSLARNLGLLLLLLQNSLQFFNVIGRHFLLLDEMHQKRLD